MEKNTLVDQNSLNQDICNHVLTVIHRLNETLLSCTWSIFPHIMSQISCLKVSNCFMNKSPNPKLHYSQLVHFHEVSHNIEYHLGPWQYFLPGMRMCFNQPVIGICLCIWQTWNLQQLHVQAYTQMKSLQHGFLHLKDNTDFAHFSVIKLTEERIGSSRFLLSVMWASNRYVKLLAGNHGLHMFPFIPLHQKPVNFFIVVCHFEELSTLDSWRGQFSNQGLSPLVFDSSPCNPNRHLKGKK